MLVVVSGQNSATFDRSTIARGDDADVNIETLDDVGLDEILVRHAIDAPHNWDGLGTSGRRTWLKSKFVTSTDPAVETSMAKANARSKSKVSLMTSLAALARPMQGAIFEGDGAHRRSLPTVGVSSASVWEPNGSKGAVSEIVEAARPDPLHHLVGEIENLNEKDALGLVSRLANQSEVTFFHLGGVLARLQASGWHKAYGSFKNFVESEHGITYRNAIRWIAVYRQLAQSGVAWDKVQKIGWTKLKEIASVVTADNQDEWIDIALENDTSQLAAIVANHKRLRTQQAIGQKTPHAVSKMTFRVHAGQKGAIQAAIDKAKTSVGTQVATVALENICANYLSGATFNQEAKAMGIDACLKLVEEAYPGASVKVTFVEAAAEAA